MNGRPRRRRTRFWRSERGQSTALVVSMLMVLILFVAVVANVGQAVNRKIALQIAADAGAFTGASVMAVGLNNMAYWNKWIQTAWAALTWIIPGLIATPLECDTSVRVADLYNAIRDVLGALIGVINLAYLRLPNIEAKRVSKYNLADLLPREYPSRVKLAEWELSSVVGFIVPARNLFPLPTLGQLEYDWGLFKLQQVPNGTTAEGHFPALSGSRKSATWLCVPKAPPPFDFPFRSSSFDVWYKKMDDDADYFVWLVTARPTKALMFDSLFGGNVIPEMKAIGVAKPVGGSIEKGQSTYKAKMMPAGRVTAIGRLTGVDVGIIYDSTRRSFLPGFLGNMRPVTH